MSSRSQNQHLGQTQQDAISLSSDSDSASLTIVSVADSEDSLSLDDVLIAALGPSQSSEKGKGKEKVKDTEYEQRTMGGSNLQVSVPPSGAHGMSRLTHLAKGKSTSSSTTTPNALPSSSKGKKRMVLDETLINGKDYTPTAKPRRRTKLIEGQSKLSPFLVSHPTSSGAGPSRPFKPPVSRSPQAGTSRLDAIELDLDTSDDDVPLIGTPRKRQRSRQPSRPPPPATSSRSFFKRGRSVTSFSDVPVELPIAPKGNPTGTSDEGLLDWLRVSPSLSPSLSPQVRPASHRALDVTASPSERRRSKTPVALKSSQPDTTAAVQHPSRTQRARSTTRPSPLTPQRRTRNTFLPPPKISAGGSLELVPETPPRPTDLIASLARTPTPSPMKQPSKGASPSKLVEDDAADPQLGEAAPTALKRRRAAFEELDEESYRPNPKTKIGREVRKLQKNAAATASPSSSRPRRVADVPGKYKLPTMDTPMHQWPRTRSPSAPRPPPPRKSSSPSKLRQSVRAAESTNENDKTPRRSKRTSMPKKTTTPRSVKKRATPRTAQKSATKLRGSISPKGSRADGNSSDSSLSSPPLERAEDSGPPAPSPAPEADAPSQHESEVDLLAEFADYAEWPDSPSHSQRTAHSPVTALLRTPSRSEIGHVHATPVLKNASISPRVMRKPELPASQSSQVSVTTRVMAEMAKEKEDARREEEEEFARRLEERKAQKIAEKAALLASDSEDDEMHLSQVFKETTPESPGPERRSRRIQGRLENRLQQDLITSAQALTEEELAAQRQIDTLYRGRKKKIDHEAFFKAADMADRLGNDEEGSSGKGLDLSFLDGDDRDAIAGCTGTQDDKGGEAIRQQRAADLRRPIFWKAAHSFVRDPDAIDSLPKPPFQWPEVNHEDAQAVYDLIASGIPESRGRDDPKVLRWLYWTAFASSREDLTSAATTAMLNALKSWKSDPFGRAPWQKHDFLEMTNTALNKLGALESGASPQNGEVEAGEAAIDHKVAQARERNCTVICQVVKALASADNLEHRGLEALGVRLIMLAIDPETSPALRSQIMDAIAPLIVALDDVDMDSDLVDDLIEGLAELPLVCQVRAVYMMGEAKEVVALVTRRVALGLLFRPGHPPASDIRRPSVAQLLTGMDIIVSGLREAEPDYYRLLDLFALWSVAAGDTRALVLDWWHELTIVSPTSRSRRLGGLGLTGRSRWFANGVTRPASPSPQAGSRTSPAPEGVKAERRTPEDVNDDEYDPITLFQALKFAANKVRDEPGVSALLKSRLNQLAQCMQQNVTVQKKYHRAKDRYENGQLEEGVGGQTRLSFSVVKPEFVEERSESGEEKSESDEEKSNPDEEKPQFDEKMPDFDERDSGSESDFFPYRSD